MLIDQFNEDQLEQIKKELKMTANHQKSKETHVGDRLREIFPYDYTANRSDEEKIWLARMSMDVKIYEIIDYTMRNVEVVTKRKNKYGAEKVLCRNHLIPNAMLEEYKQMADEILSCIEKHKK